eukprot:gene4906-3518_t
MPQAKPSKALYVSWLGTPILASAVTSPLLLFSVFILLYITSFCFLLPPPTLLSNIIDFLTMKGDNEKRIRSGELRKLTSSPWMNVFTRVMTMSSVPHKGVTEADGKEEAVPASAGKSKLVKGHDTEDSAIAAKDVASPQSAAEIEEALHRSLEKCGDGVLYTLGTEEKLPFFGKVLSKGNNLQISKSWHSSEAFLSLSTLGPRILKRMANSEERILTSDLPDGAKKTAVEMIKIYALLKKMEERYYTHQLYVVTVSTSEDFGEVISFQIKKNKFYVYTDCIGAVYRFFNRFEEVKRKSKQEHERLASESQSISDADPQPIRSDAEVVLQNVLFCMEIENAVRGVALEVRNGRHHQVELGLKSIEAAYSLADFENLVQLLQTHNAMQTEDVYVHFIALKILRFLLTRDVDQWIPRGDETLGFLMEYGRQICATIDAAPVSAGGVSPAAAWRPVFSELSATIGVALKIRCAHSAGRVSALSVTQGLHAILISGVQEPSRSVTSVVFHREMVQRVIEEFGLFDKASRRRGVPIRQHIFWRKQFEEGGLLDLTEYFAHLILQRGPAETPETLGAALGVLRSCLSWFKHRFVDADEDAAEEDTTDTFEVKGERWALLLLGPQASAGVPRGLAAVLLSCFNAVLSGPCSPCPEPAFPVGQQGVEALLAAIVQSIRLVCSYHVADLPKSLEDLFVSSHFTLCLGMLSSSIMARHQSPVTPFAGQLPVEAYKSFLPIISNGVRRLLSNFTKNFLEPQYDPLLVEFASVTARVMEIPATGDAYWGPVEELLSAWLTLAFLQERSSTSDGSAALGACCLTVVKSFLGASHVPVFLQASRSTETDETTEAHCMSLQLTCFQMAGRIGRLAAAEAITLYRAFVAELVTWLRMDPSEHKGFADAAASSPRVIRGAFVNATVTLLRLLLGFIGDPCEGEEPCIPRCFLDLEVSEVGVIPLLQDILSLYSVLTTSPWLPRDSREVYHAYADLLERYVKVYIEAEESNLVYTEAFNGGKDFLQFAVDFCYNELTSFPTVGSQSLCNLFIAVTEKSADMRSHIITVPSFHGLVELLKNERAPLHALTRGRVAACAATCVAPVDLFSCTPQLAELLSHNTTSANVAYNAECLIGMAQFLKRPDALQSQFLSFVAVAEKVLRDAFSQNDVRSGVRHAVQLAREMFNAFAVVADDHAIQSLSQAAQTVLLETVKSLAANPTWYNSEEGVNDRHQLVHDLAVMLYDIGLWKTLDCFLSDQEIAPLESVTLNCLAFLLERISEEERLIPELSTALFNALENCANAFTTSFVAHPQSATFLKEILYAVRQDDAGIQLTGVHLIFTVVSFLSRHTDPSNASLFSNFVGMLLQAIIHGHTTFRNTKHLCRAILKLSRTVSQEDVSKVFQRALKDNPRHDALLHQLYEGLQYSVQHCKSDAEAFAYFEDIAENSVAALDQKQLKIYDHPVVCASVPMLIELVSFRYIKALFVTSICSLLSSCNLVE